MNKKQEQQSGTERDVKKLWSENEGSALVVTLAVCAIVLVMGVTVLGVAVSDRRLGRYNTGDTELFYRLEGCVEEMRAALELAAEDKMSMAYGEALLYMSNNPSGSNQEINACFAEAAADGLETLFGIGEWQDSFLYSETVSEEREEDNEKEEMCNAAAKSLLSYVSLREEDSISLCLKDVFVEFGYYDGNDSRMVLRDVSFMARDLDSGASVDITVDLSIRIPYFIFVPESGKEGVCGSEGDFVQTERWRTG